MAPPNRRPIALGFSPSRVLLLLRVPSFDAVVAGAPPTSRRGLDLPKNKIPDSRRVRGHFFLLQRRFFPPDFGGENAAGDGDDMPIVLSSQSFHYCFISINVIDFGFFFPICRSDMVMMGCGCPLNAVPFVFEVVSNAVEQCRHGCCDPDDGCRCSAATRALTRIGLM